MRVYAPGIIQAEITFIKKLLITGLVLAPFEYWEIYFY